MHNLHFTQTHIHFANKLISLIDFRHIEIIFKPSSKDISLYCNQKNSSIYVNLYPSRRI